MKTNLFAATLRLLNAGKQGFRYSSVLRRERRKRFFPFRVVVGGGSKVGSGVGAATSTRAVLAEAVSEKTTEAA